MVYKGAGMGPDPDPPPIEHLTDLMSEVARAGSLEEVYRHALDCLGRALGVERAALLLFDRHDVMRFVAWRGLSDAYRSAVEGHSPWSPDERHAGPIPVPDVTADEALAGYRELFAREEIAALAFIPLAYGDRLLGKFMLYHRVAHSFDSAEIAMASAIAGHVAYAIEHMRIDQRAEQAAARLRVLAEATGALAESLDDEAALRRLADIAVAHLADYCVTYSHSPGGEIRRVGLSHRVPARAPLVAELVRAGPPSLDDPYGAGAVIREGRSVIVSEIPPEMLEVAAQNPVHLAVLRKLAPIASIVVPLRARGESVGAIALATTAESGRTYGEDDLLLVEELASRAAMLVHNSRLYRLKQEALRARDDVLAFVSHDLRSPLQAIVSSCTMIDRQCEQQAGRHVLAIRRSAARMDRLIQDLLDIARIDAGRLELELSDLELPELLGQMVDLYQPLAEDKGVLLKLQVQDGQRARADRRRILQAISNLIDNAIKFSPVGGTVCISSGRTASGLTISISDEGPGIPVPLLPHLFDRYWRGDGTESRGAGLGLAIVKGIVEAHGACIEVLANPASPTGSLFAIRLPD
jgi:signal transduction histidine kinase